MFRGGWWLCHYSDVESNAIYFEANVTGLPAIASIPTTAFLNFTFSNPTTNESLSGGYQFGADNPFFLDRGKTRGFDNPYFTDKFSVSQILDPSGTWSISGLIDRSVFEVFLDRGTFSGTTTFFPTEPLSMFAIGTGDMPQGAKVSVAVYAVEEEGGAWKVCGYDKRKLNTEG